MGPTPGQAPVTTPPAPTPVSAPVTTGATPPGTPRDTHSVTDPGTVDSQPRQNAWGVPSRTAGAGKRLRLNSSRLSGPQKGPVRWSRWYSAQMSTVSLAALLRPPLGTAVSKASKLPFRIQMDATVRSMAPARASTAVWPGANSPWYSTLRYRTARSCSLVHACWRHTAHFLQDLMGPEPRCRIPVMTAHHSLNSRERGRYIQP